MLRLILDSFFFKNKIVTPLWVNVSWAYLIYVQCHFIENQVEGAKVDDVEKKKKAAEEKVQMFF